MQLARSNALIVDTHLAPLPAEMQDVYLSDFRAWVVAACRREAARNARALAILDALCVGSGSASRFRNWSAIGPHAALRREYGLSEDAVAILLLCAAPQLWHALGHVYVSIATQRRGVDARLLGDLLGDRCAVQRELSPDSPLLTCGVISQRSNHTFVVSRDIVLRLAGG
jgi:hypothetical protein